MFEKAIEITLIHVAMVDSYQYLYMNLENDSNQERLPQLGLAVTEAIYAYFANI
jgi:hypothetical protein